MIGARRKRLLARREQLLLRSTVLRYRMGHQARAWQAPLAVADGVGDSLRWLRANLAWPSAALGLLAVTRPRLVLRWGVRGWAAWRWWRRVQPYAAPALRAWRGG